MSEVPLYGCAPPRDPLLHFERTQGFAADPDYWKGKVFAHVGLPQNLKGLKNPRTRMVARWMSWRRVSGTGATRN